MNTFYVDLIDTGTFFSGIPADDTARALAQSVLHHTLLDALLIRIPEEKHEFFAELLIADDHGATLLFVREHVPDVEDVLRDAVQQAAALMQV